MALTNPTSNNPFFRLPGGYALASNANLQPGVGGFPNYFVQNSTMRPPSREIGGPPAQLDPVTRKALHLLPDAHEQILRLNTAQKLAINLQNAFINTPKQVLHGLQGDQDSTGAHLLNIATIPYYLGGAFLAGSFAAGGNRRAFIQQSVGVALYYMGISAANNSINGLCKATSGVDLDLRYKRPDGEIQKVYDSLDFSRSDLLEATDYDKMTRKMGIPGDIADPRQEVRQRSRLIASDAKTDKLVLGNLLAAIGAGWIARHVPWSRLMPQDIGREIVGVWRHDATKLPEKFKQIGHILKETTGTIWTEAITGAPGEKEPNLRRGVLGGMTILSGLLGWDIIHTAHSSDNRDYQAPQIDRLAPELQTDDPRVIHALASPRTFDRFEDIEMMDLAKTRGGTVQ